MENRISKQLKTWILSLIDRRTVINEYHKRGGGKKIDYTRQAVTLHRKEVKDYTCAVISATDPDNPRLGDWMRFREVMKLDGHLMSCVENRILPVQCAPFKLTDSDGNEAPPEVKSLLDRPWRLDVANLICMHTFQGPVLIEMIETDENGELKKVSEIPQSNFIPQKGIILKEEYDEAGVSYREGAYKNYYFQAGEDWSLGLFSQLATIVLAKKLGLGAWLSYIDKYGVPPIFAITDRMDTGRRDELFDMLENFRMNHFAVLQGNEKIETPNGYNVDAYNTFKSLMTDVADREIEKRIQGSSGLTNEKSFVGAAEVQERILGYRLKVDKLTFQYYFNTEVIPRLVKLSSVYAPLVKYNTYAYDESETLSLKEILEAVKSLSLHYEFDVRELVKITGLPITKLKAAAGQAPPEPDGNQKPDAIFKKKSFDPRSIIGLYPVSNTESWNKTIDEIARRLHEGKLKPEQLNRDLLSNTYSALDRAASTGNGKGYYEYLYGQSEASPLTQAMRENLYWFSGAKTYQELAEMNGLLIDEHGKRRNYEEFRTEVRKKHEQYNQNYLDAEYATANRSAAAVRDWAQFQKNKSAYPNLKYCTMEDDDVRPEHQILNGIIKPVDDPFWDRYYPPNGFRCRCFVEATDETEDETPPPDMPLDYRFTHNPGADGKAFTNVHPYFSMPGEALAQVKSETEKNKAYAPYQKIKGKNVWVSHFPDKRDLKDNLSVAEILESNHDVKIRIRPHIEADGIKNPEYFINDRLADLKRIKGENGLENGFRSSRKQGCEITVFRLDGKTFDADSLAAKLKRLYENPRELKMNEFFIVRGDKCGSLISSGRRRIYRDLRNGGRAGISGMKSL
jgi:SPP1 gp7 family putative phage head morphogenesis protein